MDDPDQPSTEEKTRVPRDGERFFVHRSSESGSVIVYGSSSSCCHVTYFTTATPLAVPPSCEEGTVT